MPTQNDIFKRNVYELLYGDMYMAYEDFYGSVIFRSDIRNDTYEDLYGAAAAFDELFFGKWENKYRMLDLFRQAKHDRDLIVLLERWIRYMNDPSLDDVLRFFIKWGDVL